MIDPIIFTLRLGEFQFSLHWYGVLVVISVLLGEWIAEREMRRRGLDTEHLWEGLIWAVPAGVIGARLWYVIADILGGNRYYLQNPADIPAIWKGGLHFYGAILLGGLAFYWYARRAHLDMRLILDVVSPSLLIAQGFARIANWINQELYGPPTDLPWGVPIAPEYRLPPWDNLEAFPEETTRFHPTFFYEMIWNLLAAGLLLWVSRRFARKLRPGTIFAGWLILAGVGRVWIEAFRPDQPRLPGTDLSYSRLVAMIMALAGILWLLVDYGLIRIPFVPSRAPARTPALAPDAPPVQEPGAEAGEHDEE